MLFQEPHSVPAGESGALFFQLPDWQIPQRNTTTVEKAESKKSPLIPLECTMKYVVATAATSKVHVFPDPLNPEPGVQEMP